MIGLGLAVVAVGLVTLAWSMGTGLAILTVGMGVYLLGVVISLVGIILVYRGAGRPLPNFIQLRWSLLSDAVRARSATTDEWPEGAGPLDRPDHIRVARRDELQRSGRWRLAVWGVRMMSLGVVVVIAGLVSVTWSSGAGKVVVASGIGTYLLGAAFTLVEVRRAYREAPPPRPTYAEVHRLLLHNALHRRS